MIPENFPPTYHYQSISVLLSIILYGVLLNKQD